MAIGSPTIVSTVASFTEARPRYERLSKKICELIDKYCSQGHIHTTESRAKDIASFEKKCKKLDKEGRPRYNDPIAQITDLAGVRVIVFVRDSVDLVCRQISEILDVVEIEDVGDRVYLQGKIGYQSKHLLVRVGEDRSKLFDYEEFAGMLCEVQVRTILQHAWAEMEHDIQYKSDDEIPVDLRKRFSALAGLLELADREFQNIQRDSDNLKKSVREDLITDLTQQSLSEGASKDGLGRPSEQALAARDLINQEKYSEAVEVYSDKIDANPNNYTLFLGRSKARFLAGDVRGALNDMDRADELSGRPEYTSRMRSIMESGDNPKKLLKSPGQISTAEKLNEALACLRRGEGVAAFEAYNSIDNGSRGLVTYGRAMACCLESDAKGALAFLEALEIRSATAMAVNILALKCVAYLIAGEDFSACLTELEVARRQMPTYSFRVGPLSAFYEGFTRKNSEELSMKAKSIFLPLLENNS